MSFRNLFRYATLLDILYLIIASIASCLFGICMPLDFVIIGNAIDSFTQRSSRLCSLNFTYLTEKYCPIGITLTSVNFYTSMTQCNLTDIDYDLGDYTKNQIILALIVGFGSFIFAYVRVVLFNITAERQIRTMKRILFQSVLKKDIVYFDSHKIGEFNSLLTDEINKIRDGIGDKLGSIVDILSIITSSIIIGFVKGWKLTLVMLSVSPLLFLTFLITSKMMANLTETELKAYGKAGAVAEEVISSIRTVLCYNGQKKEIQRYEEHLHDARKYNIKKNLIDGITKGIRLLLAWSLFSLGFWYGAKLIQEEGYSIGNVFLIFTIITTSVLCLQLVSPQIQALYEAEVVANHIQEVINEPSKINSNSDIGLIKDDLIGDIEFLNVNFSYPSRSDISVVNNLTFNVKHGQTIALVGLSGSGKSTCVQLLQRFYDPNSGSIFIDGKQINEYNLKWLRQHIGVVSQEPILFQTTIRENILFGYKSATNEEIHHAAKMANAHDFIMTLPDKYETQIGECGATLSGGQKQRIAIARALISNPKILLLDEATSALDYESEKVVQEALNRAAEGRTTLIIAHRLSTIRHADKIIVMNKGEIIEEGDHDSLMQIQGTYFKLVEQQSLHQAEEQEATNLILSEQSYIMKDRSLSTTSITPLVLNKSETIIEKPKKNKHIILAVLRMNKPEWILIIIGCIAALINGTLNPIIAIIRTKIIVIYQECDKDVQNQKIIFYVLLNFGFGIIAFIFQSVQGSMFAISGGNLTKRLRSKAFRAILRQDITYFEETEHNTGVLCTRLATDTSTIQGASGVRLGFILENLTSVGVGLIIGFVFSWQLTLVILAFIPLIIFGTYAQILLTIRSEVKDRIFVENTGKVTMEAIQNIRTVIQLTNEDHFYNEYSRLLDILYRSSVKQAYILAFLYALAAAAFTFATAAAISLSTTLIGHNTITFEDMYMTFNCVAITSEVVSRTLVLSPDYGKAIEAAENIFELLKRKPIINNESNNGDKISDFTGQLDFDNICFVYPNRPQSIILNNLNLSIKAGQKIALVGTSGSGKSTIIQLIERFYDANIGQLLVDSKDIRSLDLHWYRSQIGIVSQEPTLFDLSIRENIAYGDNDRKDIPIEEIFEAAKNANIHDFIQNLPDGYETICGSKGVRLSGGQKQRIAIARALLRNPKILLLDEATSALDSESEKIVQDALDRAQENRTSITIAHRLSTIQNCDLIYVIHNGRIMEQGTHKELLALRGRYYRLAQGKLK